VRPFQAIARVLENPLAFLVILRRHEVRRVLTKRFPYRIFFTLKGEVVVVHAVLHGRRDDRHVDSTPQYAFSRAEKATDQKEVTFLGRLQERSGRGFTTRECPAY